MLTEAETRRLAAFDAMSGAEQLRKAAGIIGGWRESSMDPFDAPAVLQLVRMFVASDWELGLEYWEPRQSIEALSGKPPRWDDNEKPVYT